ncbi:endonuclease/exonuclease/phosphatase family protein [Rubripirellula reticaptiva]|uniref:endonuclease/exonuclease/phosphatase family protein n=1 Tax=Rubripirellula reticaptiva TaxID=2528013 RepID=UPI001FE5E2B9|nr:endonuclease/exonuclease/phosphatase family protein [Rubripirellula reticaptiva]
MIDRLAFFTDGVMAVVLLCLCVVAPTAWGQPGVELAKNEQSGIKVMTYNVRYLNKSDGPDVWANRRETVIATITEADIVGLQEPVLKQLDDIKAGAPELQWFGVGRDDGKDGGEFAAIGFRRDRFKAIDQGTLWLSETPEIVGSKGWDAALPRTLTWMLLEDLSNSKQWYILNTHFDHRGSLARENSGKGIAQLVDRKAGKIPVIVMGDLNASVDSVPLKNLRSGSVVPLRDARDQSSLPATGPTGTFNRFEAIEDGRRIDHIMVTDQVNVHSHQTLNPLTPAGRFASDHLPVMIEVSLATEADNAE